MRFGSLFAGIGGFDLGFERAGHECVFQVEKETSCQRVLAKHFPNAPQFDDVCEFNEASIAIRPDWICGGFPCQDLSVAGRRAGLAGKRSGLFFEFMRIVDEFRPGGVVIENVPGLLSSNWGGDMGLVLWTLGQLGYGWAYRVLDAQWFGVPQRRRRVFIVGCLGDRRRAAEILFESESLPWDSPPRREARTRVAHAIARGASGSGYRYDANGEDFVTAYRTSGNCGAFEQGDRTAALNCATDLNQNILTIAHTLRAEGHDASEDGTGRGVPLVVDTFSKQGMMQTKEVHHACTQETNAGSLLSRLRKEVGEEAFAEWGLGILDSFQSPTVLRQAVLREGQYGAEKSGVAVGSSARTSPENLSKWSMQEMREAGRNRRASQGWRLEQQLSDELGAYLSRLSQQGAQATQGVYDLRQASEGLGLLRQALSAFQEVGRSTSGEAEPASRRFSVRRLTPKEAARLQGFPDDWLAGESDSAQYRMLGNAVAVPVAEWIGVRIR